MITTVSGARENMECVVWDSLKHVPPVRVCTALFLWLSTVPWRHALESVHRAAESHLICGRVNNILVQELARVDGDIEAGVACHQVVRDVRVLSAHGRLALGKSYVRNGHNIAENSRELGPHNPIWAPLWWWCAVAAK